MQPKNGYFDTDSHIGRIKVHHLCPSIKNCCSKEAPKYNIHYSRNYFHRNCPRSKMVGQTKKKMNIKSRNYFLPSDFRRAKSVNDKGNSVPRMINKGERFSNSKFISGKRALEMRIK